MIEVTGINDSNGNSLWVKPETVSDPVITCSENVVTMTCPTSGAVIHYSTDDGLTWSVYSQTIVISSTTNYKAYASNEGMVDSGIVSYTATYVYMKLPTPSVTKTSGGGTTTYYVNADFKTSGKSGVTYYINYKWSSSTSPNNPTPSSYQIKGVGSGSDSTFSYHFSTSAGSSTSTSVRIKVIGTKPGYANSDVKSVTLSK